MATSTLDIRKRSYYLRAGLLELEEDKRVNDPDKSNQAQFKKWCKEFFTGLYWLNLN